MITGKTLKECVAEAKRQGFTMCTLAVFKGGVWAMKGLVR